LERKTTIVLPPRRSKCGNSYSNVSGWVAGWLAVRQTPVLYQNG